MQVLLLAISEDVEKNGGVLSKSDSKKWQKKYRSLLLEADIECLPPKEPNKKNEVAQKEQRRATCLNGFVTMKMMY